MLFILFIILGAIWGSFANVCIYRLPNNLGVVVKSSFCPNCKNKIKWFDNIPLVSFFFLKGKCRNCKKTIDQLYIIVELLTALSFATIYYYINTINLNCLSMSSLIYILKYFLGVQTIYFFFYLCLT